VLPTDVRYYVPRVVTYVEEDKQTALTDALDLLDEARDVALARLAVYQQSLRNYHSRPTLGGFALKNYSTHARGLRLKNYPTHARGLRLKNYSTHARGLHPSTYTRGLRPSTYPRGLRPLTYARGPRPSIYSRGLRPSTYARGLRPSTYAQGLCPSSSTPRPPPFDKTHNTRLHSMNKQRYVEGFYKGIYKA
jgi:hypothetical protein